METSTEETTKRSLGQTRHDAKVLGELIRRNNLQEDAYYRSRLCDMRHTILKGNLRNKARGIAVLVLMVLAFSMQSQQAIITKAPNGCGQFLRDTLMAISDTITYDTTIVVKVQEFNKLYTYEIKTRGNLATFTQLDREKLFTNWKGITGSMYFFGAWAAMVGHDKIKVDKVYHFAAGEVAGGLGYIVSKELGAKRPMVWGIVLGGLTGAAKELLYDKEMGRGVPTFKDGAWTFVGGVFGSFTAKISF